MFPDTFEAYARESAEIIARTPAHLGGKLDLAINACVAALQKGGKLLSCGNGGSAADAMHIAGEIVSRFLKEREGWPCICLSENPSILTAIGNDYAFDVVFARQVEAYGRAGDVLLALSTSGNSPNVLKAAEKAKAQGMTVIGFTKQGGGKLAALCDVLLDAPCDSTPMVQQVHICLYHFLCAEIENRMVAKKSA